MTAIAIATVSCDLAFVAWTGVYFEKTAQGDVKLPHRPQGLHNRGRVRDTAPHMPIPFASPAVEQAFVAFPSAPRKRLLAIRELIFSMAADTDGVGTLTETLKWGAPAYLTQQSHSGSTVRLGCPKTPPGSCALYFNCNTDLVDTFRSLFPEGLQFEGNRAIVLAPDTPMDKQALALCIRAALTYYCDRKKIKRQRTTAD